MNGVQHPSGAFNGFASNEDFVGLELAELNNLKLENSDLKDHLATISQTELDTATTADQVTIWQGVKDLFSNWTW